MSYMMIYDCMSTMHSTKLEEKYEGVFQKSADIHAELSNHEEKSLPTAERIFHS